MQGDKLASGGSVASFPVGKSSVNDPIHFNWTVAKEEEKKQEGVPSDESWQATDALLKLARHQAILNDLVPFNDRVLLRRVVDDDNKQVQIAESYKPKPNRGTVLAVGDGMVLGNEFRPIPVQVGDVVVFGEYNAESIEIDGEELVLVSAFDIRLKLK